MTNRKRAAALLLCVALVFALALSSAFIAHEVGHECSGEDCSVCRMIAVSANLPRIIALIVLTLSALFALLRERFAHRVPRRLCAPASFTLVSWKIRLND